MRLSRTEDGVGLTIRALAVTLATLAALRAAESPSGVLPPPRADDPPAIREIRGRLRAAGRTVALVSLRDPAEPSGFGGAVSSVVAARSRAARRRAIAGATAGVEADLVRVGGASVRHRLRASPCLVVDLHEETALDYLRSLEQVEAIEPDVPGRGALQESAPYVRAPEARALGFDGTGVTVAVLDSGIATAHPAFAGAIVHEYHYLDQGTDIGPGAEDDHGHGTNVAGIVASRGTDVVPQGIAPGVQVVAIKVLDETNSGWLSDWAAGVDHVVGLADAEEPVRVDVINMSLVSRTTYQAACDGSVTVFSNACRSAWERGIAIFASSGNDGLTSAMAIPACYSPVVSVGSVLDTAPDRLSSFTNRNALLDLLAPGQSITSAGRSGGTSTFVGTSQACPHAAGAACLLRDVRPDLSPEEVRAVLVATGRPYLDSVTQLTFPILDVRSAVEAAIVPTVTDVRCEASGLEVVASWAPVAGVTRFHVAVDAGGSAGGSLVESDLDGTATEFRWLSGGEGEYRVGVVPYDASGLRGLEVECLATVALDRPFVRADCLSDGDLDISDPLALLSFLFTGGATPACLDACDSNADGQGDVSDAVYTLLFLFLGGPPPPAPYPDCGLGAAGRLGCVDSACP